MKSADGDEIYPGDHFAVYRIIKSLCCVKGTNAIVG